MTDRYIVSGRLGRVWWVNKVAGIGPFGSLWHFPTRRIARIVVDELNKHAKHKAKDAK